MAERRSRHGLWSSRWTFILAATGAAVGLGNIWKFPYIAGENGGGAFVLIYLASVILLGIPILTAEILLGRRGRQNPADSLKTLAKESGHSPHWRWAGYIMILAGFLVMSYYSVISGWVGDYVYQSIAGHFTQRNAAEINQLFDTFISSPWRLLFWHTLIMATTTWVVAAGVQGGLERAAKYLFPLMFLLLLLLVGYATQTGAFAQGLNFLFVPHFEKLTPNSMLTALGQAFFTLSLAMGSIMMYGAYLPKDASIGQSAVFIAIADTLVALIAGLAIFPVVFANGLTPSSGPGLIFRTLPLAFGHMPAGTFFAALFFIMLLFAAFTSAVSLVEPAVAWLIEYKNLHRRYAATYIGIAIWLAGLLTLFSFNLGKAFTYKGMNFYKLLDYFTSNVMLPIGGFAVAIFTVWCMKEKQVLAEFGTKQSNLYYRCWRIALRYIAPIAIVLVFLNFIGVIHLNGNA